MNKMKVMFDASTSTLRGETDSTRYTAVLGQEYEARVPNKGGRVRFLEVIDGQALFLALDGRYKDRKRLIEEDYFLRVYGLTENLRPNVNRDVNSRASRGVLSELLVEQRETNRLLRLLLEAWGADKSDKKDAAQ